MAMQFRLFIFLQCLQYLWSNVVLRRAQRRLGLPSRVESKYLSKFFKAHSFHLQNSLEHLGITWECEMLARDQTLGYFIIRFV